MRRLLSWLLTPLRYWARLRAEAEASAYWRNEYSKMRDAAQLLTEQSNLKTLLIAEQRAEIRMLRELPNRFPRTMNWLTPGGSA